MKKKITTIAALTLSLLSLTPMSSSALFYHTSTADVMKEWTEGLTKVDPKYNCLFNWEKVTGKTDDEVTVYIDATKCATVMYEVDMANSGLIPASGVTLSQINEVLEQNFEAVAVGTPADTWYEYPKASGEKEEINGETYYLVDFVSGRDKEISRFLKEEGLINGYMTQAGFYSKRDICFEQILNYEYYTDTETIRKIAEYVIDNNLAVPNFYDVQAKHCRQPVESVDEGSYMMLETSGSASLEEQLDIALEIYEKFGVSPSGSSAAIGVVPAGGEVIDLYNAVEGDANTDGELDIADATLILQYIGNSDKYKLTAQGAYNADADGSGEVTALDALEVQRIDAKMR
ncbi:MAG: dockerin type I repeat-containing protein [Alistipes sp.]|nr:dockerin type I repeat-containing protein [Alistipes sp.]